MTVALHTHSWYSLLEAVPSPAVLLARAAECGYTDLALTDTNNLYGAVPFTALAQRQGIRPLLTAARNVALLDQVPVSTRLTAEHHLVDPDTLRRRFHDLPEAVRNADLLAAMLRSDVLPRATVLPPPRVPRGLNGVRFLRL